MAVFEDELNDMTQAAVPAVREHFDLGDVVLEFPYGDQKGYRTDIAGVQIDPDAVRARAETLNRQVDLDGAVDWTPLTSGDWKMQYVKPYVWARDLQVELEEAGDVLTRDDFRDACKWSRWKGLWAFLTRENYIRADDPGTDEFGFIRQEADVVDVPLSGDQYAIELKPRDWQHAYRQAHRATHGREAVMKYRVTPFDPDTDDDWADADPSRLPASGYANYAVVVMDAEHVGPAEDHARRFERAGVGLCALDRDGLTELVAPRRVDQPDYTTTRLHLNERTLPEGFTI